MCAARRRTWIDLYVVWGRYVLIYALDILGYDPTHQERRKLTTDVELSKED